MKPRPLRVLHTLSSLHVGGIGRMLLRNVLALESDRVRNHVVYFVPNRILEAQYREAGFNPICLEHRRTADGARTLHRLITLMRKFGIDLVHTNHPLDRLYAGLAAKLVGIPSITTAHNTLYGPRPATKRLRSWVESRLFSQYIAVSAAVAAKYEAAVRIPLSRINVIYSGIEVQKFGLPPSTDVIQRLTGQLGLDGADPILVSVGRLHPIKGHKHLIPMMSQLLPRWPHARLLIVGDGSERANLESAIAQAGLERSIALLGMRTDIRELLAISTAFLFPSISEGLPIAVLEAMAAGKPVIASRVGPMHEMVEDGVSGLLVPPEDPSALADAVGRLLTLPGLASQMGRQAQEIAATRFSVDAAARSMEALYRTVLSSHHA